MSEFWKYFNIGFEHVLDIHAYELVLFIITLLIPYLFKDWKRLFVLISLFTLGYLISLFLSVFGVIFIQFRLVRFLVLITIVVTAFYQLVTAGKSAKKDNSNFISIVTLFFGIIHGLRFSNYFKNILPVDASDKLLPLLEFTLGIVAAQIVVVFVFLIISYMIQTFFRFSKRDFTLVMASLIIGVVLPMIIATINSLN
jgi:hypothetical protein